jgi:hypothetical protein
MLLLPVLLLQLLAVLWAHLRHCCDLVMRPLASQLLLLGAQPNQTYLELRRLSPLTAVCAVFAAHSPVLHSGYSRPQLYSCLAQFTFHDTAAAKASHMRQVPPLRAMAGCCVVLVTGLVDIHRSCVGYKS